MVGGVGTARLGDCRTRPPCSLRELPTAPCCFAAPPESWRDVVAPRRSVGDGQESRPALAATDRRTTAPPVASLPPRHEYVPPGLWRACEAGWCRRQSTKSTGRTGSTPRRAISTHPANHQPLSPLLRISPGTGGCGAAWTRSGRGWAGPRPRQGGGTTGKARLCPPRTTTRFQALANLVAHLVGRGAAPRPITAGAMSPKK